MLAAVLATGGHWTIMFLCLGIALIIDAADGPLAREFKVAETLPRWSGETLDLVVDFTTYVFVPAYAIVAGGLLPHAVAILCGMIIVVTGAIYFSDREMKTRDNYFQGFPAAWNLAAFYLFLLEPPGWAAALMVVALATLSFAPVRFVHPVRVIRWRPLNLALVGLWSALALLAVFDGLDPGPLVTVILCMIAVYFLVVGYLAERTARA